MILASGYKEPNEVRDIVLNFASEIGEDVISDYDVSVTAGDVTITEQSEDGRAVTLTVAGGTAGTTATVHLQVRCYGGTTVEGDVYIRVSALVVGVNTYVSLTGADEYFAARANASWLALTADARDAALVRAAQYLDGRYRGGWKGVRTTEEQLLAWPRYGARDEDNVLIADDAIPLVVVYAQCEAALRESASPGSLTPDMERLTKREQVGPLSVEYATGGSSRPTIPVINDLLSSVLKSTGGGGFVSRA